MTATCLDFFQGQEHDSPQAIVHLTEAFGLMNQRLSTPDAISDTTIALTCMLSIQESLRGDIEKYKTHMSGLYRMIELRGGIQVFKHMAELLYKVCR